MRLDNEQSCDPTKLPSQDETHNNAMNLRLKFDSSKGYCGFR